VSDGKDEGVDEWENEGGSALRAVVQRWRDRAGFRFEESRTPDQEEDARARAETWGRASAELKTVVIQLETTIREWVLEAEAEGSPQYQMGCRVMAGVLGMEEGYDPETRKKRKIARDLALEE
jgi:hypothetical protein